MHDPIGSFLRIRDLYVTYLETAFRIADPSIAAERRNLLETNGTLCSDAIIEPSPRYSSSGIMLEDLANAEKDSELLPGFSSRQRQAFVDLALAGLLQSIEPNEIDAKRRAKFALYTHQALMLRRGVQSGKPGIVTS